MTAQMDERIEQDAIAWHVRLGQGNDADWEPFVAWLEQDERHNRAYEAVADRDRDLDGIVAQMAEVSEAGGAPEVTPLRAGIGRRRFLAMAACAVLLAGGAWLGYGRLNDGYEVATAPGEIRNFALADGTRIAMNGATRLILHRHDPRSAQLVTGEAHFTVHHDPAQPFTLDVEGQRIIDVGTVFNVQKTRRALRVEVAEGAVRYVDGDVRLRLGAGDTLEATPSNIVEGTRPVSTIGTWTQGRLVYRDRPLADVAADLSRSLGVAIELAPDLSARRFTGVIQLDGDDEAIRLRISRLLGVGVVKTSDGWTLAP